MHLWLYKVRELKELRGIARGNAACLIKREKSVNACLSLDRWMDPGNVALIDSETDTFTS